MLFLDQIAHLPSRSLVEGEMLIQEGTCVQRLYFLKTGKVLITRDEVRIAIIKTPGSVLGEMSVLLGVPSTASVVAMEDSTFYMVEEPLSFLDANPKLAVHMARGLAHRLDSASRYIVDVKSQLAGCSDHISLMDGALDAIIHRDLKDKARLES